MTILSCHGTTIKMINMILPLNSGGVPLQDLPCVRIDDVKPQIRSGGVELKGVVLAYEVARSELLYAHHQFALLLDGLRDVPGLLAHHLRAGVLEHQH